MNNYDKENKSTIDYYPFGQEMPGRVTNATSYRFGFNGKENDNEVAGTGNWQNYGMREYDARACRFMSVDPITAKYPMLTPYQFASNSPIMGVDLDGKEILVAIDATDLNPGHTILIVPDYKKVGVNKSGEFLYQIQGSNIYATPYGAHSGEDDFIYFNNYNSIGTTYIPKADIKDFFTQHLKNYDGILQLTNKDISLENLYYNYLDGGSESFTENQIKESLQINPEYVYSFANSPKISMLKFSTTQEKEDSEGKKYGAFYSTINCAGFVSLILQQIQTLEIPKDAGVKNIPDAGGHKVHSPNKLFHDLKKSGAKVIRENKPLLEQNSE